ncbi:MAG TPA: hypothetical protein VF017_05960 [Thermoanaerobaculia bacterium]|nr:hypothetical protein [Thermoanaerobaculia bacterium]
MSAAIASAAATGTIGPDPHRPLRLWLRFQAAVMGCAFLFVFVPTAWMQAINNLMGLGPLPEAPIVGYLTRSLSALYGVYGSLHWLSATDPERLKPLIRYMAWAALAWGPGLAAIDLAVGMPATWIAGEALAPPVGGLVTLWLVGRGERR